MPLVMNLYPTRKSQVENFYYTTRLTSSALYREKDGKVRPYFFSTSFSHLTVLESHSRDYHLLPAPVTLLPRRLYPTLCLNLHPPRSTGRVRLRCVHIFFPCRFLT